jgi:transposase
MPTVFIPVDRDQTFLMPVDFGEVLGEDHLVWTVLDVVGQLDLATLYARYGDHEDGGRPAYEPSMMVALLFYAYAEGLRSSRAIERACRESWAYRAITANLEPDHATIARFRAAMDDVLKPLFAQVLAVCVAMGMGRVGVIAVDGTKIAANASKKANAAAARLAALEAEAQRLLEEAAAADAGEAPEAKVSPQRRAAERQQRLERVQAAKVKVDAEVAAAEAAKAARATAEAAAAEEGRRLRGRKPKDGPPPKPVANTTDPDSGVMKVPGGFVQGYNAQAVAGQDQLVLAAEVTTDANDSKQLGPMLSATQDNLAAAGIEGRPAVALADAGYWSAANASLGDGVELLIATGKGAELDTDRTGADRKQQQRDEVIAAAEAGELTSAEAAQLLGVSDGRVRQLRVEFRRRVAGQRTVSPQTEARLAMQDKLAEPANRALYNQRGWMIEGVFGQAKEGRNCRRFMRRGLAACDAEWKLIHLAGNIRKAWRRRTSGGSGGPPQGLNGSRWALRNRFCRHRSRVQNA